MVIEKVTCKLVTSIINSRQYSSYNIVIWLQIKSVRIKSGKLKSGKVI